ncbi:hypothetical protein Golax_022436, partial [Gossypium laxum]|nr:hypothetical protein [Gossypium laxum]
GPHGVKLFILLILNQRLLTNVERVKRGIGYDSFCGICGHHSEDIFHVLRDCPVAKEILTHVLPDKINGCFFAGDLLQWLKSNLQNPAKSVVDEISLCTDGEVQIPFGNATAKRVIRNRNEEWIMRYNRHLGNCSILDAELWGILDRLTLIHDRQYAGMMIQTDNLEAVKIIQDSSLTSSNFVLIRRIHLLLVNAELW